MPLVVIKNNSDNNIDLSLIMMIMMKSHIIFHLVKRMRGKRSKFAIQSKSRRESDLKKRIRGKNKRAFNCPSFLFLFSFFQLLFAPFTYSFVKQSHM